MVVPCSTSNLGCGFDCLGLALERDLTLDVLPAEEGAPGPRIDRLEGTLAERALEGDEKLTRAMYALASAARRRLPPVRLHARSSIPVARGLGSSGAATVAGLVAANVLLGRPCQDDELFDLACALEGHPDNVGPAIHGGCICAMPDLRGKVHGFQVAVHPELRVAVACPTTRVETARARGVLPREVPFRVARDQARKLAQLLRGLETLDPGALALGTADELHTPFRLPLIPGGAEAMTAARDAGAIAVAISGSGSSIVALGRGDLIPVAQAMENAFAGAGEAAKAFVSAVPAAGYQLSQVSAPSPKR